MAKKIKMPEFVPVNEADLDPGHRWHRPLQAPGITQVEWTADGAVQFGDTGLAPLDPQMPHEKR